MEDMFEPKSLIEAEILLLIDTDPIIPLTLIVLFDVDLIFDDELLNFW